jgi:hypothetical protein
MTLARDVPAEVNGQETRLLDRGHHRCGRLARAVRPDPERTLVANDRMARIDV